MARVPRLLDVSVPLSTRIPAYPGNPTSELQPIKRVAEGGSANVSRLIVSVTRRGVYEMYGLPLHLDSAECAPARVVLKQ